MATTSVSAERLPLTPLRPFLALGSGGLRLKLFLRMGRVADFRRARNMLHRRHLGSSLRSVFAPLLSAKVRVTATLKAAPTEHRKARVVALLIGDKPKPCQLPQA